MSDDRSPSSSPSRWRRLAPGLLAAALALIVFSPSLGHGFAYDDAFILRSPLLREPWRVGSVLLGGFHGPAEAPLGIYRPLGYASFVLNAALARTLFGSAEHPLAFHAVNLLLHAAASFLVFVWLSRLPLSRFVAGAAAVLWAVHPMHAEVALNIWARFESLAAVFGLGFLITHRSGKRLGSTLFLLAALGSKESALTLLPLALATDAMFPIEGRRFRARSLVGPCLAIALWFGLRAVALGGGRLAPTFVENPIVTGTFLERVPTAAWVQLLYLRDQLLPAWLSTDHSYAQIDLVRSVLDPGPLAFFALLAAAAIVAAKAARSELPIHRGIALAVAGYAIAFSITSQFLVPIGTIMGDRLAYLPSIFTCLLAAIGISFAAPARLRVGTVVLAAGALAGASLREIPQWKDNLALFQRQVITAPRSAKSHGNLGNALRDDGQLDRSIAEYQESIRIYPYRPEPYLGLAQVYELQRADPELLILAWSDAIRYGTSGGETFVDEALAWIDLGRWKDLAASRAKLTEQDPARRFLAHTEHILRAAASLAAEPVAPDAWLEGRERFAQGDFARAASLLQRALHRGIVPAAEIPGVLADLARCHTRLGHPRRAEHFERLAAAASREER